MRHAQALLRLSATLLTAGWAIGSTGCVHNHYYYPGQAGVVCDPAPGGVVATYDNGALCEVPPGGVVVSQAPGRVTTLGGPSRVVLNSEPIGRPPARGTARFWKRSESEVASTRLSGGIDDESTTQ